MTKMKATLWLSVKFSSDYQPAPEEAIDLVATLNDRLDAMGHHIEPDVQVFDAEKREDVEEMARKFLQDQGTQLQISDFHNDEYWCNDKQCIWYSYFTLLDGNNKVVKVKQGENTGVVHLVVAMERG